MGIEVVFTEDPTFVLKVARAFLASQPVSHNLVLSLLDARTTHPEPGRYWLATEDEEIVGVILQSPLTFDATLTPMDGRAVEAMVSALAKAGISLPGINGDATTAARFAGQWSERQKCAATPFQGSRLYEWLELGEATHNRGTLRLALPSDRSLMMEWFRAFSIEIGELANDLELRVDRWIASAELWLWDDEGPMSMAVGRKPAEGVVRISGVFTPTEKRNRGYATACVHALSKHMRHAGFRCVLYTDLANPTSNSIYRRIGYRAMQRVYAIALIDLQANRVGLTTERSSLFDGVPVESPSIGK
jgi:RimJ/RimL family protein N-acetyltransferase